MKHRAAKAKSLQRELAPARRAQLLRIKEALKARSQIDPQDCGAFLRLISLLEEGYDPRIELGIPAKAGAPPWAAPFHRAMALRYWLLRDRALQKAAVAKAMVATEWNVSVPLVTKYARKYRDAAREYISATIPKPVDITRACEYLAEQLSTPECRCTVEDALRMLKDEDVFRACRQDAEAFGSEAMRSAYAALEDDRKYRARMFAVAFEQSELRRMFTELLDSHT